MDTLPFHSAAPELLSCHLYILLHGASHQWSLVGGSKVSNGEEDVSTTIDHLIELFHGLLYSNMATTTATADDVHPDVWTSDTEEGTGRSFTVHVVFNRIEIESRCRRGSGQVVI